MAINKIGNVRDYEITTYNAATYETTTFKVNNNTLLINSGASYANVQKAGQALAGLTKQIYSDTNLLTNVSVTERLKDIQEDNSWIITTEISLSFATSFNKYTRIQFDVDLQPEIPQSTKLGMWMTRPRDTSSIYNVGIIENTISYNSAQNRKYIQPALLHTIPNAMTLTTTFYIIRLDTLQLGKIPVTLTVT